MKKIVLAVLVLMGVNGFAGGYQSGWKVYEKPQPGVSYGGSQSYGQGGGKSYAPGGGQSYGAGGGKSYGVGGANSYGPGGGKNIANPWKVADED